MTAPANRWKLGLFVIAGLGATLTGVTWVGAAQLKREFHLAFAYFDEALTGLEEGSPVKFRGVTIGVVQLIVVAPDQKHLKVQAALYDDKLRQLGLDARRLDGGCPLPDDLRAQVVMSWVTGTSFIQVDFFPDPPAGPQRLPFAVPVGENTLRTVPSTAKSLEDASRDVFRELPSIAGSARELVDLLRSELQAVRLGELSRQLQQLLTTTEGLVQQVQRTGVVARAEAALASVEATAASLRDERGPLGTAIGELRGLLADARRELVAADLAATTAALRAATGTVAAVGGDVQQELPQLRAALAAIERLAALLERDPGALLHGRANNASPLQGVPK